MGLVGLVVDPDVAVDLELLVRRLVIVLGRMGFAAPQVAASRAARPLVAKPRPFKRRIVARSPAR